MSADRHPKFAGLTQAEAEARLAAEGYNELPAAKPRGLLVIVLEVIREPMFLLLVAASTIYLLFGDLREGAGAARVDRGGDGHHHLSVAQNRKCARGFARSVEPARAGDARRQRKRIAGREVVRGDVMMLKEGDRVPADAPVCCERSAGGRVAC